MTNGERRPTWDFDEREIPPMSAEMFSALVTARLRPLNEIEILGGKGLQLRVRVRGAETLAQLERAYERYRANPDALSPIIDTFIDRLLHGATEERAGNEQFARVREKLLPRLMTAQQWMKKRDEGLRVVVRSIVQDLGAALILDNGADFEYVQIDAIPAWEIDSQTAYAAATENLERRQIDATTSNGEGIETLLLDHSENASANVMLPSRLSDWQARIQGELVLGLPTHDLLLGFARAHPAFEELRAQVAHDAQNSPNGLLATLLLVREGELQLLSP